MFSRKEKVWRGVQLEFEENKPHRVKGMQMWNTEAPVRTAKK
jgi:hypothetical protein